MGSGVLIGSLVDAAIWISIGIYVRFFAAEYVEKRIQQGKMRPENEVRYKRSGYVLGWIFIALGVLQLMEALLHSI